MGFVVVVVVIFITNNNIANTTLVAITTLAQDKEEAVDCGGALRGGALHYPSHDWLWYRRGSIVSFESQCQFQNLKKNMMILVSL